MLLHGTPFIQYSPAIQVNHRQKPLLVITNTLKNPITSPPTTRRFPGVATSFFIAAAVVMLSGTPNSVTANELKTPPPDAAETFANIPQTLSGECVQGQDGDCKKARIQKPKSRKAESCTRKCVTTCIRGGDGSPGEGPINVRRPLVVFKQGFRTRHYCLVECSDICNLIGDRDDGP